MSEALLFGYSRADISPDRGVPLEGYEERLAVGKGNAGILDPLYVRALALRLGDSELLLITLDLCVLSPDQANALRAAVAARSGVVAERIMISCSHTHSGPVTFDVWSTGIGTRPTESRPGVAAADAPVDDPVGRYVASLTEAVVSTACSARFRVRPCALSHATATVGLGYNRRLEKSDGSVEMLFSLWANPDALPTGPIDAQIPILCIDATDTAGRAAFCDPTGPHGIILVSCPVHPVCLGKRSRVVSGDYPGALIDAIETELPSHAAMFMLGACGDVQPMISTQENPKGATIIGRAAGYSILTALASKRPVPVDTLDAVEESVDLRRPADVAAEAVGGVTTVTTQTFAIGSAAVSAASAECFTEYGPIVRSEPGWDAVLVATNTNGWSGYIPTADAFRLGGYEVAGAVGDGKPPSSFDTVSSIAVEQLRRLSAGRSARPTRRSPD
ncbi:MAG: hypothetical protein EA382_12725 [Spirochaetaceae bacterium]|nr:MAG: hypothetical protein EA382_12725 [Spirochaetaceae bacterium]